ncbi:polysaccharide pyruvyl transferase family protein [uncultured Succinivibrio sp.]|uniref:polysaccharide pyruvyl transferase family protein n=1 Tax=uncultured Succinivibrio sp. TaxID=540749 RepID=UPI0025D9DCD3|nr:polysaccharide pyruvyl transferase family protein [uncultured Succinivibrio sp.]
MKIGILTLSASDNCGSLLQAFALQETIIKHITDNVEIIDLRTKQSEHIYRIIPLNPMKEKRRFLHGLFHYHLLKKQKDIYENFRKKHLKLTDYKYKTINDLKEKAAYDILVVGSDQVWNVCMYDFSNAYFLGWTDNNTRKISYAASLGGHFINESKDFEQIKKWLRDFSAVSIRESFTQEKLSKLIGREVEVLLDPTLLIKPEQYKKIAGKRLINDDYIFYYSWSYNNDEINRTVKAFSDKYKIPVYVINFSKWFKYKPRQYGFKFIPEITGPIGFLNLMINSRYSLVQSFHGVVFSYIFNKDFWFLDDVPEERMDKRLANILTLLNAKDRVIRNIQDVEKITDKHFDYSKSLTEINRLREHSIDFLKKALNRE